MKNFDDQVRKDFWREREKEKSLSFTKLYIYDSLAIF